MSAAYRLTPRASYGLRRILSYVEANFGSDVADRVLTDIEEAFDLLATHPGVGHQREDLTRDEHVLFWSFGPTLIAYRSKPEWVEILFVERGELDWEGMLAKHLE